jgi:glycosyltransferase involved in cell wall biosynthesis
LSNACSAIRHIILQLGSSKFFVAVVVNKDMSNDLISIIVPTIGRSAQLEALLYSITCSTYKHYEVIVIDQNQTRMIDDIILKYSDLIPIQHIKVNFTGAAKARNCGLPFANGQYIFFPDDDSELYPETLELAMTSLKSTGADVLFGKYIERTLEDYAGIFSKQSGYLSFKHHEKMFVESTMFIKKATFSKFLFDESFGVGTFYGAEEGYDIVLRMLYEKVKIFYTPEVKIYHPLKVINHFDSSEIRRVFSYRCGFAHLCVKHKLYRKYCTRLLKVMLYIAYAMVFAPRKVRYYLSELMGLLTGIIVR